MKKAILALAVLSVLLAAACTVQDVDTTGRAVQEVQPVKSEPAPAKTAPVSENTAPAQTEKPAASAPAETTAPKADFVSEEYKCDVGSTIGFKSCSPLSIGDYKVNIAHQGMATLTGAQYYFYDENNELVAKEAKMGNVKGGFDVEYILPFSKYKDAIKADIRPLVSIAGVDTVCINQQVVIIPKNSCR